MIKSRAFFLFVIPLLLLAGRAFANPVFVPSLTLGYFLIPLFIPVVVLEALVMMIYPKIHFWNSLKISLIANLGSTVLGIIFILPVEIIPYPSFFWGKYFIRGDMIGTYLLCYLLACISEYFIVKKILSGSPRKNIFLWSLMANSLSYLVMLPFFFFGRELSTPLIEFMPLY